MEQNDEIGCFFTCWYKWKFEVDEKYWGGVGQKLVGGHSHHRKVLIE